MTATVYVLPGLRMVVQAGPLPIQREVEWLFKLCPVTRAAANLHLAVAGLPPDQVNRDLPVWALPALRPGDSDPLLVEGPAGELAIVGCFGGLAYWALLNRGQSRARLVCSLRGDAQPRHLTQCLISLALYPVLREVFLGRQQLLLHSAVVKCPDGTGIQLVAESGGGKTTTCLSLVRLGARLVADDLVVVSQASNLVTAHGLPKPLNLRTPTLGFFSELLPALSAVNPLTGKATLIPQSIYGPACLTGSCPIHVLYFLNLSSSGPAISTLGAGEALAKLVQSHAFCIHQATRGGSIAALCELLASVSVYRLHTGGNPDLLGGWIRDNCQRHACRQGLEKVC